MRENGASIRGYAVAAFVWALVGGILVASATNLAEKMAITAMRAMSAQMRTSGCNPQEM